MSYGDYGQYDDAPPDDNPSPPADDSASIGNDGPPPDPAPAPEGSSDYGDYGDRPTSGPAYGGYDDAPVGVDGPPTATTESTTTKQGYSPYGQYDASGQSIGMDGAPDAPAPDAQTAMEGGVGVSGPPANPDTQPNPAGSDNRSWWDRGKDILGAAGHEVADLAGSGPTALKDTIAAGNTPWDDPGAFLKDAYQSELGNVGGVIQDAMGVGSRVQGSAAIALNDAKQGNGQQFLNDINPATNAYYSITGDQAPWQGDVDYTRRNVVSNNPLGAVLPGSGGSGEGPQVIPDGVPLIGGDSLYDLPIVGGLARAGSAVAGSFTDSAQSQGPSIDVGALSTDLQNGMSYQQAAEKYKGSVGSQIVSELANPVNFVEVPGLSEAIGSIFETSTGTAVKEAAQTAERAGAWTPDVANQLKDAAEKRGAITQGGPLDMSGQSFVQQSTDLQSRLAPGLSSVSHGPDAAISLTEGAARLAEGDTAAATAIADSHAAAFGGTPDGILDIMQTQADGMKANLSAKAAVTPDQVAAALDAKAAEIRTLGSDLTSVPLQQAAAKLGIDLAHPVADATEAAQQVQAAVALAAKDSVTGDLRAGWYDRAPGVKLPGTETAFVQGMQGIASAVRGLLLAGSAPPLALQKFSDEWFRALTQGTMAIRLSDTATAQAVARLGERSNFLGLGDQFAGFRANSTVGNLIRSDVLPPSAALRNVSPSTFRGALTGTGRFGQELTPAQRFSAAFDPVNKWNQSLIAAPTQHVVLNALHQDTKGLGGLRAAYGAATPRAIPPAEEPPFGEPIVPSSAMARGTPSGTPVPSARAMADMNRTEYGLVGKAGDVRGPVVSTKDIPVRPADAAERYAAIPRDANGKIPTPAQMAPDKVMAGMSDAEKAAFLEKRGGGVSGPSDIAAGRVSQQFNTIRYDTNAAGGFGTGRTLNRYEGAKGAPRSDGQARNDAAARIQRDKMDAHLNATGSLDSYYADLRATGDVRQVSAAQSALYIEQANAEQALARATAPADVARISHDLAEFDRGQREIRAIRQEIDPNYVPKTDLGETFGPDTSEFRGGYGIDPNGQYAVDALGSTPLADFQAKRAAEDAQAARSLLPREGAEIPIGREGVPAEASPTFARADAPGIGVNRDLRDLVGQTPNGFPREGSALPIGTEGPPVAEPAAPFQPQGWDTAGRYTSTPTAEDAGIGHAGPPAAAPIGREGTPAPAPAPGAYDTAAQAAINRGLERGYRIVGNTADQTTAGSWMQNGLGGVTPPVLPFAPFHIHSAQFWAEYFGSHPALALGMAQVLQNLDDYGTLHLAGGNTLAGLIKMTTGLHVLEWAQKAYEYHTDNVRAGINNPFQVGIKDLNYNLFGNNAFVRPFEYISGPAESITQKTTNPLLSGKKDFNTGQPLLDSRDAMKEFNSENGTTGLGERLNTLAGGLLPRNVVNGLTNPGQVIGNTSQSLTDRLFGVNRTPYNPDPAAAHALGFVANSMGLSKYAAEKAYYQPSTPAEVALGKQLHDAVLARIDTQAMGKLAPLQANAKESLLEGKGIYAPSANKNLEMDKPVGKNADGSDFTLGDLLRQSGVFDVEAQLKGMPKGDAKTALENQLSGIKAELTRTSPVAAAYLQAQDAAYKAQYPGFRDGLKPNEQQAYDAFNDLKASADYKSRNDLEAAAAKVAGGKDAPKGSAEHNAYTEFYKANGDRLTQLNNIVNGAEQSIVDRFGVNPKDLANRASAAGGFAPSYADTTIPGQKAPFSSGTTTTTASTRTANAYTPKSSGSKSPYVPYSAAERAAYGRSLGTSSSGGGGAASAAIAARNDFNTVFSGLTKAEQSAAYKEAALADVLTKGSKPTAEQWTTAKSTLAQLQATGALAPASRGTPIPSVSGMGGMGGGTPIPSMGNPNGYGMTTAQFLAGLSDAGSRMRQQGVSEAQIAQALGLRSDFSGRYAAGGSGATTPIGTPIAPAATKTPYVGKYPTSGKSTKKVAA